MSIPVTCSGCGANYRVKDKCAGTRGRCPHCRALVDVPPLPTPADPLDTSWLDGVEEEEQTPATTGRIAPGESKQGFPEPPAESPPQRAETIAFRCQHCGASFRVNANLAGHSARCSKCARRMKVPQASEKRHERSDTDGGLPGLPLLGTAEEGSFVPISSEVDHLLGELDSLQPISADVVASAAPPPQVDKKKKANRSASQLLTTCNWSDLGLATFLVVGLVLWGQYGLFPASVIVMMGTFLIVLVTMFSHEDYKLGTLCVVMFCCLIGPLVAGVRGLQKGAEWGVQRTALVLLITAALTMFFRSQEAERSWDELEKALDGLANRQHNPRGQSLSPDEMQVEIRAVECFQDDSDNYLYAYITLAISPQHHSLPSDCEVAIKTTEELNFHGFSSYTRGGVWLRLKTKPTSAAEIWIQGTTVATFRAGKREKSRISNSVKCQVQRGKPEWAEELYRSRERAPAAEVAKESTKPEAPAPKKPEPPPNRIDPGEGLEPLDAALARLQQGDFSYQRDALRKLAQMTRDEARQDEVASTLAAHLDHRDQQIRKLALEALATCYTPDVVPAIIEQLNDTNSFHREDVIKLLVRMKEPRAVPKLAELLVTDRFKARQYLTQMGPMVENEVAVYLRHPDHQVREEACRVLGAVGTAASVPALFKLERDPSRSVYAAADRAIREIRFRHERSETEGGPAPGDPRFRRVPNESP